MYIDFPLEMAVAIETNSKGRSTKSQFYSQINIIQ